MFYDTANENCERHAVVEISESKAVKKQNKRKKKEEEEEEEKHRSTRAPSSKTSEVETEAGARSEMLNA